MNWYVFDVNEDYFFLLFIVVRWSIKLMMMMMVIYVLHSNWMLSVGRDKVDCDKSKMWNTFFYIWGGQGIKICNLRI